MEPVFCYITWDANPEIFSIGNFSLRWYSLMFLLGFLIGYQIMKKFFENEGKPTEWLDTLLLYLMIGTIFGARIGHCVFYDWEYFSQHLLEIILPVRFEPEFKFIGYRGLASHGGAIGIIFMMWLFSKRVTKTSMLWILDRVVIPIALTGMFIRLGNLMNSEILGNPTDVAWGFIFKKDTEFGDTPVHPVQLYESICYLGIFVFMFWQYWKTNAKDKLGFLFGTFLVLLWSVRFILEYFKRSQGGIESVFGNALSTGQLLSIPFVLIGVYFIVRKVPNNKVKL